MQQPTGNTEDDAVHKIPHIKRAKGATFPENYRPPLYLTPPPILIQIHIELRDHIF